MPLTISNDIPMYFSIESSIFSLRILKAFIYNSFYVYIINKQTRKKTCHISVKFEDKVYVCFLKYFGVFQ